MQNSKIKDLWNQHKGKIAIASTVTAVAVIAIGLRAGRQFNQFLAEEGLTEKYYNIEDEMEVVRQTLNN